MALHQFGHTLFWTGLTKTGAFRILRLLVMAVGLTAMAAMTIPDIAPEVHASLVVILWCCLGFFTVELILNCWPASGGTPSFTFTAAGIIDLLGVIPIPVALLIGINHDTAWLLASLWLLKLTTVVPGIALLARVIALEALPLASVLAIFLIVILFAGTALYLIERSVQPEKFGSLPLSLWWAVTTLTTTGYGDAVPETFFGRVIAGMVMISGLGVFGLWTGILANGFASEHRRLNFMQNWDLVTRVPFLRNLDPPTIIALTRMLRRIDLAPRTTVVRRGRPGDCMYFIASGEVEVEVEPRPIRLGPGAFFGEIALLRDTLRTATVSTTAASTLLMLEVADFRDFTAHHPELAQKIAEEAMRRTTANEIKPQPAEEAAETDDDDEV